MKLELKHLAGYLPYGLKCRVKGYDDFEVDGISLAAKKISQSDCLDSYDLELTFKVSECKPILRPLSDLYREINGEVGIVELAKIEHPCSTYHILRNRCVEVAGDNGNSISFRYDKDNNYFLNSNFDCDDEYYPIMYQLELFEYLFQHHFDVYGLIEKVMAIDINTIENV